ncbi:hypothetical protein WJX84_011374 [Apatococcus fuscideae]|uniref:Uncharacterized protein n=1 Tax=Apatococcus fuscideae TaxID=2026836 RepID=A0AAW1RK42_9CHLO
MGMEGSEPSWIQWFLVALPIAIASVLAIWCVILAAYQPGRYITRIRPPRPPQDPFNRTQGFVIGVTMLTVVLWCAQNALAQYVGSMGVIAILPMVAFFGTGILSKDDFNSFLWHVVMLAMGGLALGEAVKSSGLLQTITHGIENLVQGYSVLVVFAIFCGLVLICTTFISHTVGAMVILPIVQSVGAAMMPVPHARLLVMGSALMCSGAMGLPISGFPNMNAVSLEDATGVNYVGTVDFLVIGVPSSLVTYGMVVAIGYPIMLWLGF